MNGIVYFVSLIFTGVFLTISMDWLLSKDGGVILRSKWSVALLIVAIIESFLLVAVPVYFTELRPLRIMIGTCGIAGFLTNLVLSALSVKSSNYLWTSQGAMTTIAYVAIMNATVGMLFTSLLILP